MLLINAAKRAEVIPTSAFTQLIAPLAQILALALVTALYLAFGRRTGTFGLVAFLLNAFALSALVGVEFVINLVFRDLPGDTVEALRNGSLGIALTAVSILFLIGTLAFLQPCCSPVRSPRRRSSCTPSGPYRSRCEPSCLRLCWTSDSPSLPWESAGSRSGSSTTPAASPPGETTEQPTYCWPRRTSDRSSPSPPSALSLPREVHGTISVGVSSKGLSSGSPSTHRTKSGVSVGDRQPDAGRAGLRGLFESLQDRRCRSRAGRIAGDGKLSCQSLQQVVGGCRNAMYPAEEHDLAVELR